MLMRFLKNFYVNTILNNKIVKVIAFIAFLCSFAFTVHKILVFQENNNIWWIVLSFLLQFFLSIFLLHTFIPDCVKKDNPNQITLAFLINFIYMLSSTLFFYTNTQYSKLWFQIVTFVNLFLLLIFVYIRIKRVNENDLSYLKTTNYFMIIFLSGVLFLLKKNCKYENIYDIIYFYYLFPLLMLQGLYGLLVKKENK